MKRNIADQRYSRSLQTRRYDGVTPHMKDTEPAWPALLNGLGIRVYLNIVQYHRGAGPGRPALSLLPQNRAGRAG